MSITQLDIRATKYLSKHNVETTKYFTQDPYDIDELERKVQQNTEDISTLNGEVSNISIQVQTNTTNITTNSTDISGLKTRMSTAESNISTNTSNISSLQSQVNAKESSSSHDTDIANLQSQINSLDLGSPYEGLYKPLYRRNGAIIEFNYNIGKLVYWTDSQDNNRIITSINNVDGDIQIDDNTESLILPGTIKILNADGSIYSIGRGIKYYIDEVVNTQRKIMSNLKSLTFLPGVYKIDLVLSSAPNLSSLNLFSGLEEISLSRADNSLTTLKIRYLAIPDSVKRCTLTNLGIDELVFNCEYEQALQLKIDQCNISNKLVCKASLTSDSEATKFCFL